MIVVDAAIRGESARRMRKPVTTGSSGWQVFISLGDYETEVTLILEADSGPTAMPNEATTA